MKELHVACKNLYTDSQIPFLHTCLKEIITTAIERFEQNAFFEIRPYAGNKGTITQFVSSPLECKDRLDDMLQKILSQRAWSPNQGKAIN